ncbi:hypothetical protein BH10BAC5_BH10BAC5_10570 [soil metagenome]
MKKFNLLFALLISLSFLNLKAQDDTMKKWMDYMTPGDGQKGLAMMVGDWKVKNTFWMDPNGPPTVSEGTAKCEMLLGGRYMKMTAKAEMMGMPFEGIGTNAYDNASKTYQSTWIDNMGTGIMYMEGTMDPVTKVVTYYGSMMDPIKGMKTNEKQTITWNSPEMVTMEMYSIENGKETKTMEIVYTR